LTVTERDKAVKLSENDDAFKAIPTSDTKPRRVLIGVSAIQTKAKGELHRVATVTHYEYSGGITIRTTVDLDNQKVTEVKRLEAYPTPFSPEERLEAVSLASRNVAEVRAA